MGAGGDGTGKNGKGKGKENRSSALWNDFTFDVPGFHDEVFWDWKDVIVASEMQILKRLGFHMQVGLAIRTLLAGPGPLPGLRLRWGNSNIQVDLPYSHVINYCKILDLVFEDDVAQTAWSILNDA